MFLQLRDSGPTRSPLPSDRGLPTESPDSFDPSPRQAFERPLLAGKRPLAGRDASNLGLLCHLKSIVDLDAEIANCAFQLRMPEQQLYGPKILRPAVDQRGFCTAHSVGAIRGIVEANRCDPAVHNPGVLPRRQMRRRMQAARKQKIRRL